MSSRVAGHRRSEDEKIGIHLFLLLSLNIVILALISQTARVFQTNKVEIPLHSNKNVNKSLSKQGRSVGFLKSTHSAEIGSGEGVPN